MSFYIKLADKVIQIENLYAKIRESCQPYAVPPQAPDIRISLTREDLYKELEREARIENGKVHIPVRMGSEVESMTTYRRIAAAMLDHDTLLVHGVLLAVGDDGYLITAKSGVGKTTRALQWVQNIPGAYIVNGDKPLLRIGETVRAYGTPWSGKEGYNVNTAVTLRGVCVLERSEQNFIQEIGFSEAFPRLLAQTFQPDDRQGKIKAIQLLGQMKNRVKFYHLRCSTDPEAAVMAYSYMKSHQE